MTGYRLKDGGTVDRSRRLSFSWDGTRMKGFAGDTLASALIANGERVVARSFKYHRPRGITSAGPEEGGALVTTGEGARRTPNQKAPEVELFQGLKAKGQNAWPSVRFDLGQVNDLMGRFFAAGFYYKTFFGITGRGTGEWMAFEKAIRRAAGLGTASREADPDAYEHVHAHCDLLVIGAGPAGLAAAETAAEAGLDVMLVEQDFALGGRLIGSEETVEGTGAPDWLAARIAALSAKGVRVLTRAAAIGLYDTNVVAVHERLTDHLASPAPEMPRGALHIVRPGRVIMATGAIERPVAFGDNDRPGVMLADALATYVRRFGVAPADRAVIAACHDGAYASAEVLAGAGIETTLVDARAEMPAMAAERAEAAGVRLRPGTLPVKADGAGAHFGLRIGRDRGGAMASPDAKLFGAIGVSGGWSPAVHLACHRGAKTAWNEALACFTVPEPPEGTSFAGAAAGRFTTAPAIEHARAVAEEAVAALTGKRRKAQSMPEEGGWEAPIRPLWEVTSPKDKLKSFVDLQHDVTAGDVRQAAREGYRSVEHMKRYTTLGMATDQGKTAGVVGLALLADALGQSVPQTGITTFRPPWTPTPIGLFAGAARGEHWRPVRQTPMHGAQAEGGAVFTDAGLWKRAWYHPAHEGETLGEAYVREARAVRETCGMVDVSTLGKIAVQGPDAAEFLNRVYVNGFAKLPVMKARYGVMLRDDGLVFDDGVTLRLGETEYLMTTTTAHAGEVMAWLERLLQARWPDLRVHVSSVTDQWAGVAVAGPRAREAVARVLASGDVSAEAMPFMGIGWGEVAAPSGPVKALIARVSFSGERAYELHVPSGHGPDLWTALAEAVAAEGGVPYGVESLGALRIEKGHVTGAELDGRVTLTDAGLGGMASSKKPFIGQALSRRPDLVRSDRPRLAQFEPVEPGQTFSIGAIVCAPGHVSGHGLGWITGVTRAPAFEDRWVGIGFVAGGPEAWEEGEVVIADPVRGKECRARVFSPHRLDPKGERMHG